MDDATKVILPAPHPQPKLGILPGMCLAGRPLNVGVDAFCGGQDWDLHCLDGRFLPTRGEATRLTVLAEPR